MYAKRALMFAITTIGLAALAAVATHQFGLGFGPLGLGAEKVDAAQPGLRISSINTTPNMVSPVEVLTISTTMTNSAADADGLTVKMVVLDEAGQPVLQEKQSGIGVPDSGKQSVFWVWRVPNRLADGTYDVEMTVVDRGERVLATSTRDAAFRVDRSGSSMASSRR